MGPSLGAFQTHHFSLGSFLSESSRKSSTQPLPKASHLKLPDLECSSLSDSDTCFFFLFFCACDIWKWKQSCLLSNGPGLLLFFCFLRQGQCKNPTEPRTSYLGSPELQPSCLSVLNAGITGLHHHHTQFFRPPHHPPLWSWGLTLGPHLC